MLNSILENELKKSLFIEYYYGRKIVPSYFLTENKNILCEEHGIMPHMDEYIDTLLDFLSEFYFCEEPQTITITENIFSHIENCFFENIFLQVEMCETNKSNVNGYMNVNKSKELENDKIPLISGKLHIFCPKEKLKSSVAAIFAHEITHVYENYKRIKSNAPSIYDIVTNSNYSNNSDRYTSNKYDRKMISNIVYYTTKFEVNAYAASIYGTLKMHADEMIDAQDALDLIKYYSPVYQNFVKFGTYIQNLNIRYLDKQLNNQLIEDAWFSATGENKKCGYIVKKLASLYNKIWRKLRKVTSKICYNIYEKYGPIFTVDEDNLID
jgi:hypothetical protein